MASTVPVNVEVALAVDFKFPISDDDIRTIVIKFLSNSCPVFRNGLIPIIKEVSGASLSEMIESIRVTDLSQPVSFWQADVIIHLVTYNDNEPEKDFLEGIEGEESSTSAYEQWELPNRSLSGLWESIIVEESIKKNLIGYCNTSMLFSKFNVDPNIITWNRMVLLHGPPGTGKTTLCKALAQKLFIRNSDKYETGFLMEINSHSLFSKWFSESGKMVMKLFEQISDIADDESSLVCILIDEVESIASSRNSASKSNEPGDAVRVVNAVLTSIDSLKRRPNVMILCTSNMLESIDTAFRDRIDYSVFMGCPSLQARSQILHSCIVELSNKGIIDPNSLKEQNEPSVALQNLKRTANADFKYESYDILLQKISSLTENISGRSLRKLPLKAHAFYLQRSNVENL